MLFWKRNKNWEDEYDEYYTRDVDRGGDGKARYRYLPHLLLLAFVGAVFCAIVGAVAGMTMLEKLLVTLAMPVGLLWLFLLVTVYFCLINRNAWPATMCFICWLMLTVAGNAFFSNWLAGTIEHDFLKQDLSAVEPYDVVVVLGGGTTTRLSGSPQVSETGDRIVQTARLWHAGKARQVMCTGLQSFRSTEDDLHPYEEATMLFEELGVSPQVILNLNGVNTSEEMQNLKKWSDANPGKRIGLLTSAWHLPRAERLAKAQGISVEPIAAGFFSQPYAPSPGVVVPGEYSLMVTAVVAKEYLARLVNR